MALIPEDLERDGFQAPATGTLSAKVALDTNGNIFVGGSGQIEGGYKRISFSNASSLCVKAQTDRILTAFLQDLPSHNLADFFEQTLTVKWEEE